MSHDLGDKVTELQTDKGIVFSVQDKGSSLEDWTYFANGKINRTYGTYVALEVCEPIRKLYLSFRNSASDKTSEDYEHKLMRLIRVGRSADHDGTNGYALILVNKNGEYELKLHRVVKREISSKKKEISHSGPAAESEPAGAFDYEQAVSDAIKEGEPVKKPYIDSTKSASNVNGFSNSGTGKNLAAEHYKHDIRKLVAKVIPKSRQ